MKHKLLYLLGVTQVLVGVLFTPPTLTTINAWLVRFYLDYDVDRFNADMWATLICLLLFFGYAGLTATVFFFAQETRKRANK